MTLSIISLPGAEACGGLLARKLNAHLCGLESRRFPDGEIYLRVVDDVRDHDVVVVAQLREPDPQLPGMLFLADALRELGAARVGLVAPYLPYMRQDARFHPGEAVTARAFAKLVSSAFDWLVTVDPHLHRYKALNEVYRIPAAAVPSAPAIAAWVHQRVARPVIIGPDEESLQWVAEVADLAGCPHTVFRKLRRGDREIELELPDLHALQGRTPVLVDDIISSAHTMAGAVRRLRAAGLAPAACVGVHAVFAADAAALLQAAGAASVVSCNTLSHPSNAIDVTGAIAEAVRAQQQEVLLR